MAKAVKSNPLMISVAEKVGSTVGLIVAKTTNAVEGASRLVEGAARSLKPAKATPRRVAKRKAATIKKTVVRRTVAARERKRPAKK